MKSAMRWLAAGALVGVYLLTWGSNVGRDVVGAQGNGKPAVMKRIYTGTDGQSHVEDIALDAKSVMEKVTSVEVRVGPPGRFGDWHVGPQRQYIINLAGSGQLEVAEGKVDLPPGSMEYIDDLTGKGHTTRTTSKEERVSIWLKFEDQKQRIGPMNPKTATSPKP
jgi:quercetin dioxygenase-like cupin family protein